jgi:hypothetical protein
MARDGALSNRDGIDYLTARLSMRARFARSAHGEFCAQVSDQLLLEFRARE